MCTYAFHVTECISLYHIECVSQFSERTPIDRGTSGTPAKITAAAGASARTVAAYNSSFYFCSIQSALIMPPVAPAVVGAYSWNDVRHS